MLECKHCGSDKNKQGKPWHNQGALNLHESRCELEQKAKGNEQTRNQQQSGNEQDEDGCNHKLKVLNGNRPDHARAMNAGFKKYCTECGELA